MGIVLHLTLLVSFTWMAVEGVRLYHLLTDVFSHQQRDFTLYYMIAGYAIPCVIVGITVLVAHLNEAEGIVSAYVGDETYEIYSPLLPPKFVSSH